MNTIFLKFLSALLLGGWVLLPLMQIRAEDSPLEEAMEKLADAKKELYPALNAPVAADKEKYLKLAKEIKSEAEKARDLIPAIAEKLPPDQKDSMAAAYKKDMESFIAESQRLIDAVEKEQWTEIPGIVAKLKEQEKAGHKAYRKKKEKA